METKTLLREFESLNDDIQKWRWIRDNQNTGIVVLLDNDDTYGIIRTPNSDEDGTIFQFQNYIGNSDGVYSLLLAFGIRCEGV